MALVAEATSSRSPANQATSAMAAATGPTRWSSPVGAARAHASSSRTEWPGSPRLARTTASTTRAAMRGVVEALGMRSTASAVRRPQTSDLAEVQASPVREQVQPVQLEPLQVRFSLVHASSPTASINRAPRVICS